MVSYKEILETIPITQSVGLLGQNNKFLKKKKKKAGDIIGAGISTIIGAEFIGAEADIIGSI